MANHSNDILSGLIIEFSDAITPLSYLNRPEGTRYMLGQLGYAIPPSVNFNLQVSTFAELPPKIARFVDALNQKNYELATQLLVEIIPKVKQCFEQVIALANDVVTMSNSVPNFVAASGIGDNLPKRIIDYLIITHVEKKYGKFHSLFMALGIFKKEPQAANAAKFWVKADILSIHWEKLPQLFSNPEQLIKESFKWGIAQDFILQFVEMGYGELLLILEKLFHSASIPAGIFPHHGDTGLEFTKARNRELRVPLFRVSNWPTSYGELGVTLRLYTGQIYAPVLIPPIDAGSGTPSDEDDEPTYFPTPAEMEDEDGDGIPDGNTNTPNPGNDGGPVPPPNYGDLIPSVITPVIKPSIPDPKGIELQAYAIGTVTVAQEIAFPLGPNWQLKLGFKSGATINEGINLILEPQKGLSLSLLGTGDDRIKASGEVSLAFTNTGGEKDHYVFGRANESHLLYKQVGVEGKMKVTLPDKWSFDVKTFVKGGKFVLTTKGMDGFLAKTLPDTGINTDFDITVGWNSETGVYFEGSGGLEIMLPAHIQLGPIEIQGLTLSLEPKDGALPVTLSSTIKATLGPLQVVVENIGIISKFYFPDSGNGKLGPLDFDLGIKPPNGLGLSINAGAVVGGGYLFFDYEKEEYAGALELTIAGFISAKAIGLITTKMPDGSKGFSMLIVITAEFNPPFQLGYGFTLIGVGGLLGLNRTVLLDPLREGVRTGAVNNIMFPQNVVANAPRIISDLKTIFPAYEGKFLIGPMGKLGWGTPTLISLSLGLIIEIPGNIAILGVLKIVLPEERLPLVKIQVAFVGTLDFNKKMLTFDASLFESSVLIMTLEGDMAVRLKWGENPDFLLSVGGFHPSYTPPPLSLPSMRRLAINILNTSVAKIRVECYMAVTSNTVQFGAKAELFFGFSAISIEGHIAFDALFQFSPFYFIIQISASVSLKVFGAGLFSVRLRFSLEGPTPWRAKGTGSITILFFEVSADFDTTWGEAKNTAMPETDILPRFLEEINKREQWSTALSTGKNLSVSLRRFTDESAQPLVLHPAGSLVIQQKLVPLTVTIDRVGNKKTADVQKIAISSVSSNGVNLHQAHVNEDFARSQYQKLTDAEKLSKPSFEKMPGGVQVSMGGNSIQNGKMVRRNIAYEITIVDKQPRKPLLLGMFFGQIGILFTHFLKGNSASKSVLSKAHAEKRQPFAEKVEVRTEGYSVAFKTNNQAFGGTATFASEMSAQSYLRDEIGKNPNLKKELHIIPNYELQEP